MKDHRQNREKLDTRQPIVPAALKLKEACEYLGGISKASLRRLIGRGLIKPNRVLRHVLVPVSELERFLKEQI